MLAQNEDVWSDILPAQKQIRFKPDGSEDPDCIFNQTPYRDAPIILSRENFGCGSSREGAVWALKGMGIKAVIAPYFGDIFNNNCFPLIC